MLHLDRRNHSPLGSFRPPPPPLASCHGEPWLWAGPGGKRNTLVGQRIPFDVRGAPALSSCRGNRCLHWLLLGKRKKKTQQNSGEFKGLLVQRGSVGAAVYLCRSAPRTPAWTLLCLRPGSGAYAWGWSCRAKPPCPWSRSLRDSFYPALSA